MSLDNIVGLVLAVLLALFVAGVMVGTAAGLIAWFRRKRWI